MHSESDVLCHKAVFFITARFNVDLWHSDRKEQLCIDYFLPIANGKELLA